MRIYLYIFLPIYSGNEGKSTYYIHESLIPLVDLIIYTNKIVIYTSRKLELVKN